MLQDYTTMPFPEKGDIIYLIGIVHNEKFIPFYIGQTSRNIGRFGDYVSAKFSASTDFKVGEAIKYLRTLGYKILIKYKESEDRRNEEKGVINEFKQKNKTYPLLNEIDGYGYTNADENSERLKIRKFIDSFLECVRDKPFEALD
jgi:hypothetical protein